MVQVTIADPLSSPDPSRAGKIRAPWMMPHLPRLREVLLGLLEFLAASSPMRSLPSEMLTHADNPALGAQQRIPRSTLFTRTRSPASGLTRHITARSPSLVLLVWMEPWLSGTRMLSVRSLADLEGRRFDSRIAM